MEESYQSEFEEVITGLAEMFKETLSDVQLELYWSALKDLEFDDFKRVSGELLKSNIFMPKPVEFRERVGTSLETEAQLAYGKVEEAFTKAGADKSVIFDDSVIHAVIDNLGGWVKYCKLPKDEVKWWRKSFEEAYVNFKPLVEQGRIIPPVILVGLYAGIGNIDAKCKEPVFIGEGKQNLVELSAGGAQAVLVSQTPVDYTKGMGKVKGILKSLGK